MSVQVSGLKPGNQECLIRKMSRGGQGRTFKLKQRVNLSFPAPLVLFRLWMARMSPPVLVKASLLGLRMHGLISSPEPPPTTHTHTQTHPGIMLYQLTWHPLAHLGPSIKLTITFVTLLQSVPHIRHFQHNALVLEDMFFTRVHKDILEHFL